MLQTLAVGPIVDNVAICSTEGGWICIGALSVLIFNVTHKIAMIVVAIMITAHKKHDSELLVLGMITSLLSFCGSW